MDSQFNSLPKIHKVFKISGVNSKLHFFSPKVTFEREYSRDLEKTLKVAIYSRGSSKFKINYQICPLTVDSLSTGVFRRFLIK